MIMDMMLGVGVAPKPPPPPLVFLFIINHLNGKAENMYHPLQIIIGAILSAAIYHLWRWVVVVERRSAV